MNVGQGDLLFVYNQGSLASGSLDARLEVSVYSGYNLCHRTCPKI